MVKIVEMDERVKLEEQLEEDVDSVILLNKFNVNPENVDEFMKRWAATLRHLRSSQVSSSLNCIGVSRVAVHSSTMLYGSQLHISKIGAPGVQHLQ
jgi:hypothetical protein